VQRNHGLSQLNEIKSISIAGIKTACLDREGLVSYILNSIDAYSQGSSSRIIFDINGHGISLAHANKSYMEALKQADIIHADGQSIVTFSKWLGGVLVPERTATTDLIHDIPSLSSKKIKHFFLGSTQENLERCTSIMQKRYNNFSVSGSYHGYFSETEKDKVIASINEAGADILWVGMGKPKEQEWIIEHRDQLNVPVIISCGGCFNYITGVYKRAPMWMQNHGFEWLHRMLTQPRTLFLRYLITNPHAIYCVIKHAKN
jgi:exopolysaccharide biosynthesis WecB/TagA/CpsF family protein